MLGEGKRSGIINRSTFYDELWRRKIFWWLNLNEVGVTDHVCGAYYLWKSYAWVNLINKHGHVIWENPILFSWYLSSTASKLLVLPQYNYVSIILSFQVLVVLSQYNAKPFMNLIMNIWKICMSTEWGSFMLTKIIKKQLTVKIWFHILSIPDNDVDN